MSDTETPTVEMSKALVDMLAEHESIGAMFERNGPGVVARAASCYAEWAGHAESWMATNRTPIDEATYRFSGAIAARWPWGKENWKPQNPRRDMVRAAAMLLLAVEEIDARIAIGKSVADAGPAPPNEEPTQ